MTNTCAEEVRFEPDTAGCSAAVLALLNDWLKGPLTWRHRDTHHWYHRIDNALESVVKAHKRRKQ